MMSTNIILFLVDPDQGWT